MPLLSWRIMSAWAERSPIWCFNCLCSHSYCSPLLKHASTYSSSRFTLDSNSNYRYYSTLTLATCCSTVSLVSSICLSVRLRNEVSLSIMDLTTPFCWMHCYCSYITCSYNSRFCSVEWTTCLASNCNFKFITNTYIMVGSLSSVHLLF